MFNLENHGIVSGNLTSDPHYFDNADGSRKIFLTVAAQNSYQNKDGSWGAQFLPVEKFTPAEKIPSDNSNGIYDRLHKGDRVTVLYTVKNNNYVDKATGRPVYGLTLQIDAIKLLYKADTQQNKKSATTKSQVGTRQRAKRTAKSAVA